MNKINKLSTELKWYYEAPKVETATQLPIINGTRYCHPEDIKVISDKIDEMIDCINNILDKQNGETNETNQQV